MKKKGIIGAVLTVCLLVVLASPVLAAAPIVTSVTANSGNVNTAPIVAIVGTGFVDGVTTVSLTGAAGVTPGAVNFTDAQHISCTFTIAADAAAGARNVYVTVAGETSTETVTFMVNPFITVSAPTGINLGYMTAGQTKTGSSLNGSVSTNDDVWSVSAVDAKTTAKGYMNTAVDGSGTSLAAKFKIGKDAGTLVDASTAITYTQADTTPLVLELYVSQVVALNAPAGSYSITITFTGSN